MTTTSITTSSTEQLLDSSVSSLSASQATQSPHVARTYKQASQLFLTRRIGEALTLLEPVITPPSPEFPNNQAFYHDGSSHSAHADGAEDDANTFDSKQAPIATATRAARVKVWSLYISILNAVADMTAEEGREELGSAERWKELIKQACDGDVWADVVRIGYGGIEGNVDADVVANLATLLLSHASSQKQTQQRLETYLSAASSPSFDVEGHMAKAKPSTNEHINGTSTPRDLNARLKILEIYTLHVLPRNEEWDYAKEFINMSEILDEDRREAFLLALQALEDEKNHDGRREEELKKQREQQQAEEERRQKEQEQRELQQRIIPKSEGSQNRSGKDESGYGVEKTHLNGTTVKPNMVKSPAARRVSTHGHVTSSPQTPRSSGHPSKRVRPAPKAMTFYRRASMMMVTLQEGILHMGEGMTKNPMVLFRMVLFLVALLMAFGRRDVRDRLNRLTHGTWDKVKQTVGMGVKISYI